MERRRRHPHATRARHNNNTDDDNDSADHLFSRKKDPQEKNSGARSSCASI